MVSPPKESNTGIEWDQREEGHHSDKENTSFEWDWMPIGQSSKSIFQSFSYHLTVCLLLLHALIPKQWQKFRPCSHLLMICIICSSAWPDAAFGLKQNFGNRLHLVLTWILSSTSTKRSCQSTDSIKLPPSSTSQKNPWLNILSFWGMKDDGTME